MENFHFNQAGGGRSGPIACAQFPADFLLGGFRRSRGGFRRRPGFLGLATCFVATLAGGQAARAEEPVLLQGPRVQLEARLVDGQLEERYAVRRDEQWVPAAVSAGGSVGPVSLIGADGKALPGKAERVEMVNGSLVEHFTVGKHRVIRTVGFAGGGGDWLHVTTRLEPESAVELHAFGDHLRFAERPDWSYAPSVGGFVPDGQYKAPVVLVQAGRTALALVPDLDVLSAELLRRCNHALELDVPGGPMLGVGYMPAKRIRHSVYAENAGRNWTAEGPVENSYYVFLTAQAEPQQAYRQIVRFHWERFGAPAQAEAALEQVSTDPSFGPKPLQLWDAWRPEVWDKQSVARWLRVPLPGGGEGGAVKIPRLANADGIYTTAWFQSLRTSYGMALYARRTGKQNLLDLAGETLKFALASPGPDGAFKCIAIPNKDGQVMWAAGDGRVQETRQGFLGYDMAWTGYWLLRWREAKLPAADGVLERVRKLAEFFLARQTSDGMFPTRLNEDGSVDLEKSKHVKAETAPVALFLLKLYSQDKQEKYLAAARRGLEFLDKEVIPLRQWYDFETFWSCSPRSISFDERTGQWPANDLAMSQAPQAYLDAWRITGEAKYLAQGEAVLDYLLLFQQCWTNPALNGLSCRTMLLGGTTTQNSDAEWSDWRHSQIGNVLLDYHRATGKAEYLLRGVAALRASFPVAPAENWAHEGYGGRAGESSFHTGTGSGMAGIEIEHDYLGDAVVDVKAGRAVGVNGINVTGCQVAAGHVRLTMNSPFAWTRPARVVLRNATVGERYQLSVNGRELGEQSAEAMERGIEVALTP